MEYTIYLAWYLFVGAVFSCLVSEEIKRRKGNKPVVACCMLAWPIIILLMIFISLKELLRND